MMKYSGRIWGKLVSIIYLWLVFHLAVLVLRNTGDFIGNSFTQNPIVVIQAIVAIIAAFL